MRQAVTFLSVLVVGLTLGAEVRAAGDPAKGKKVFNRCKTCHTVTAGKHRTGPSLLGVIGRKAGTAPGFKKYKGLKGADWVWDEELLDTYLKDPKKFTRARTKRTASMILKTKKAKDRANVIAYLKSLQE